ncbi:Fe3+-hydroxamate ABC transporter substrate-binding protein [Tersicoccus solisilvae]|uniref:Fe3+-hydroxamate ABC transporter substrate-binding protein n=1 Tax=Tersicoccus solisilvae TaxID=1882339 RepID=A0ABQ1NYL9_9MICC|nr:ABC transporter substrate-binding protein [Tersicoccus solisilvae]GGC87414.1 Fe3+-hydroxamate ABC transporter substrate-binding protein [Tersicoccus solisilvae]
MRRRHHATARVRVTAAGAVIAALALAGCSGPAPAPTPSATDSFPVTAPAPTASAVVTAAPQRVAAIDLASADLVAALGGRLAGAPSPGYAAPWFDAQLNTSGLTPTRYHEVPGISLSTVKALKPDLIVAADTLLDPDLVGPYTDLGAPVVSSPGLATADWRDRTREVARAIGRSGSADPLIENATRELAEQTTVYPSLKGKTFLVLDVTPAAEARIQVHTARSGQVQFLEAVGMTPAPAMAAAGAPEPGSTRSSVPAAAAGTLAADVLIVNFPGGRDQRFLQTDPHLKQLPAVASGKGLLVQTSGPIHQALDAATPDSFRWAIDNALPDVAETAYLVDHPDQVSPSPSPSR